MLWQATAAACIGSLFYVRRVTLWLRRNLNIRSPRALGFVFATAYAVLVSPVVCSLFRSSQLPRFGDIFVLGIVLTAYFFTWEGAAYLLAITVVVSASIISPYGTLTVTGAGNWYRLASFAGVSLFLIGLISRVKARQPSSATCSDCTLQVRGAAAAAD